MTPIEITQAIITHLKEQGITIKKLRKTTSFVTINHQITYLNGHIGIKEVNTDFTEIAQIPIEDPQLLDKITNHLK